MLPHFVVIGAQKSATSSLCDTLGRHDRIFMCNPKEPFFFSRDAVWQRGLGWYERLFDDARPDQVIGEGTTECTQHGLFPHAPDRLAEILPDARLIYMVRHPLDRMVSHYIHMHTAGGREQRPFNEAVLANPAYVDHSLYDYQLSFYRDRFPEDRIHVCFYEDFVDDPAPVVRGCLDFLGVEGEPDAGGASHRNSWRLRAADTPALRLARGLPGFRAVKAALPDWAYGLARGTLKRSLDAKPAWQEPARREAADRVRDDARRFCHRYGKPEDFWNL